VLVWLSTVTFKMIQYRTVRLHTNLCLCTNFLPDVWHAIKLFTLNTLYKSHHKEPCSHNDVYSYNSELIVTRKYYDQLNSCTCYISALMAT